MSIVPGPGRIGALRRRPVVGVALARSSLTAVRLSRAGWRAAIGSSRVWRIEPPAEDGTWPALVEAFRAVRGEEGPDALELHVALLAPLAWAKRIALPRVREDEAVHLLERSAERFFPLTTSVCVGVGRRRGGLTAVAAASNRVLGAVEAAAREAGCRLGSVTSGAYAAAEAMRRGVVPVRRGHVRAVLLHEESLVRIELNHGALQALRCLPAIAAALPPECAAHQIRDLLGPGSGACDDTLVLGPPPLREALEQRLGGLAEASAPALPLAEELAAAGAAWARGGTVPFATAAFRTTLRRRVWRRRAILATAAAASAALAAALHLAGIRSQTAAAEARRAELRPAVEAAQRVRAEIARVSAEVAEVEALDAARSDWISLLAQLTAALPPDASLTSLRLLQDEVRLEGWARSAAALVPRFERESWVRSVRLGSPVRREVNGPVVRERFSLSLALRPLLPAGRSGRAGDGAALRPARRGVSTAAGGAGR